MKLFRTVLSLALALALCLGCAACAEEVASSVYQLGDQIEDFTVTTWDGNTITLSGLLAEKDMVLINIWATWCGPCRGEFPFMEEAYEQYSDEIEIVALSCEETDTDDVLADFVAEMGLTFPVAGDTAGISSRFVTDGIPTSVVVDRNGVICFIEVGAMPDAASFARLFDVYVADDYTDPVLLTQVPAARPDIEPATEDELAAALNAEGASLAFANPDDEYAWPMVIAEMDGRSAVVSSNSGVHSSYSAVSATVSARAGDAVAVTFKLSSQPAFDLMQLSVNGEVVKSFGGERDWTTYAYAIEADGDYEITVAYVKDGYDSAGDDMLWIDSVALLSGDEAAAALAANPFYPVADETTLAVANADARQIVFDDPDGILLGYFGECEYYIIPGEEASFTATLSADVDPETVFAYTNYDGISHVGSECVTDDGYTFVTGVDSLEGTGYSNSSICLYPSSTDYENYIAITYFSDEENVNAFVNDYLLDADGNVSGSWHYADGGLPSTDSVAEMSGEEVSYMSVYTISVADQNGDPVPEVMVQVCNDETCMVYSTDETGVCEFELEPFPYEIHLLKLPEGYEGDTETVTVAPEEGGELAFEVTKN